jgi:hypothetical protein
MRDSPFAAPPPIPSSAKAPRQAPARIRLTEATSVMGGSRAIPTLPDVRRERRGRLRPR